MSVPHLILHKVRGSPAFDIAEPFTTEDGEEMWIVSTSGHRAYPLANWELQDLADISDYPHEYPHEYADKLSLDEVPDHYPANTDQRTASVLTSTLALLQSIGLGPKAIKRRKVE